MRRLQLSTSTNSVPAALSVPSIRSSTSTISLAGSGTISVTTLLTLPPEEAIRILNEISYPNLDLLFRENPELSARYRALYEEGIVASRNSSGSNFAVEAAPIQGIIGTIPPEMATAMKLPGNIISMRLLLDWWLLYFLRQKRYLNGLVYPDEFTNRVLGKYYQPLGLTVNSPFEYRYLVDLFLSVFTPISQVNSEERSYLRAMEHGLELRLREYRNLLSEIESVPDFIDSVLEMDDGVEWSER